jgi:hypothetical protein
VLTTDTGASGEDQLSRDDDEARPWALSLLTETVGEARRPGMRMWAGVVAAGAVSLGLGAGLELSRHLELTYRNSSRIIGWVSAYEYPKQQEMFYFVLALGGAPCAVAIAWGIWLLVARGLARSTARPVDQALRATACAFAPLTLAWCGVFHPERLALTLAVALGLSAVVAVGTAGFFSATRPGRHTGQVAASVSQARSRLILAYGIVPLLIYVATYTNSVDGRIDLYHEGERLAPLAQLRHGGISFRDAFVQHGLVQDVTLGWLGEVLFSPTLEGIRILEAYVDPLLYVALYLFGTQVFRWPVVTSLLLTVLAFVEASPLWPRAYFSRSTLGFVAIALLAGCVVRRARGNAFDPRLVPAGRIVLAGVFAGAALWHSVEIGLYTLTAGALFLLTCGAVSRRDRWADRLRPLGLMLAGTAAVVVLGAVPFAAQGALLDLVRNVYEQIAYQIDAYATRVPSFFTTLGVAHSEGWTAYVTSPGFRWYLPILGFVASAAYLTHRWLIGDLWRSEGSVKLLLLLLAGAMSFRTALGRADHFHLVFGSMWLWAFCLMPLDRVAGRLVDRWKRQDTAGLPAAAFLVGLVAFSTWAGFFLPIGEALRDRGRHLSGNPFARVRVPTTIPGVGAIAVPEDQRVQVQAVVDYIRGNTAPGERIFDFTNQGAYYYFSDRPPATRLFMMMQAVTPKMEREVIEALDRQRVNLVIFSTASTDYLDGTWSDDRRPLIAEYIYQNFEVAAEVEGTTIVKRRPNADRIQTGATTGLAGRRLPEVTAITVSLVSPGVRGFGPVEGPYPQWNMARPVRWMQGKEAEIRFKGDSSRRPFVLRMNVLSFARHQRIDVLLNGVPVIEHPFRKASEWELVVSREFTLAPENRLTFRAARADRVGGRNLGVLFDELAVTKK